MVKLTGAERSRRWRDKHPGIARERYAQYRQRDPERYRGYGRKKQLKKYGLTIDDYERLYQEQRGLCALCRRPPAADEILTVDHDHGDGRVRGLLHGNCNTAIGLLGDDLETVEQAAAYLRKTNV